MGVSQGGLRRRAARGAVGVLLGVLLLVGVHPGPAVVGGAALPPRDVLFVGNSGDGTVDLIDAHTFTRLGVLDAIPDGNTPRDPVQAAVYPALVSKVGINYVQDIQLSPDGEILYVSRGYLGDVAAFSLHTHSLLWRLQIHSLRADHMELSPNGSRLFVSALTSDLVEVIDTRTHRFVGEVPAGDWPHTLGFSPDGRTLYGGSLGVQTLDTATSQTPPTDGRHWLEAIDPHTLLLERPPCELSAGIRPFALAPDGRTMYLQLSYYNGIVAYDPVHCRTLRRLDLPLQGRGTQIAPHDYPNEAAQHGVAMSRDAGRLCLAGTIDDDVEMVTVAGSQSLTLSRIIPVGQEPAYAVTSPDGSYCFVSSRGATANTVSVISYASQTEVVRIPTGNHPQVELAVSVPGDVLAAGGFTAS
jgi:DNA-binding beta-propeller fold protein YncE